MRVIAVETLRNPWKGLKRTTWDNKGLEGYGRNPKKSLEGIKTLTVLGAKNSGDRRNPKKSLEGIKTTKILTPCVCQYR